MDNSHRSHQARRSPRPSPRLLPAERRPPTGPWACHPGEIPAEIRDGWREHDWTGLPSGARRCARADCPTCLRWEQQRAAAERERPLSEAREEQRRIEAELEQAKYERREFWNGAIGWSIVVVALVLLSPIA